jgi:3-oxoacyl-(acyl-carrier-protein) synthase III
VGYTANRDYREELTPKSFPTVDILEGGRNYIAFGSEPFTPNNKLNTDTYQAIDQMTYSLGKHTIGVGASFERFKFENVFTPTVNGQFVFKNAVVRFSEVINEGLQANNLQVSDINLLVPHQANLRISQFIQKKFGLKDEQVHNNVMKFGNTTAASIPIALTEAWEQGKIKSGDTVVLAAFGSGFTWASAIIKW